MINVASSGYFTSGSEVVIKVVSRRGNKVYSVYVVP